VAGYFDYYQGTPVDFNPGEGFDQHVSNGSYDIFVSKFKSNGDFLWARTWGSSEGDSVGGLGVDKWNNIFVHGYCGWADLDPGPGIDFKPGGGFLSKFNQGGAYQWSRNWGDSNVYTAGMAVDASGNVFLTGSFYGEMDFDPGPGTEIHSSGDYEDVYLIKFDPLGYYFWGLSWGGEYNDEGWCIDVNDAGEVFVAGSFTDLVDFDPGPGVEEHWGGYDPQGFISKFDTNSQFQWVITCGPMYPLDIEIGPFGGIHTTGNFSETVDLDPGPGQNLHKSFGYSDACVVRYTKDGDW
jgi:hypothetical protein